MSVSVWNDYSLKPPTPFINHFNSLFLLIACTASTQAELLVGVLHFVLITKSSNAVALSRVGVKEKMKIGAKQD